MAPRKSKSRPATGSQAKLRLILSESIPSRTEEVEPLVQRFVSNLAGLVEMDGHRDAIDLALREALVNAIVHGNKHHPGKKVRAECYRTHGRQILLVVRDQGRGFDPRRIQDPTRPANLERATGRGIFLIRKFMDQVRFCDGGREIQMKKKCC
ncbi:MAG: ATP-binding protein [Candidatus Acidiferrales bacterium]